MAAGWPALRRHRGRGRGGDAPVLVVDWLAGMLTIARNDRCAWVPSAAELSALPPAELAVRLAEAYRLIAELAAREPRLQVAFMFAG